MSIHPLLAPRHPPIADVKRAWTITLMLAILILLWFFAYPQSDILFSGLFFADRFYGRHGVIPVLIYDSVYFMLIAAITLVLFYTLRAIQKKVSWRVPGFLFGALLLGPGVVVNAVLKENLGRARPDTLLTFGGDATFTAPWVLSDQCVSNCSFVSGHASMAFYFVALAFIWASNRRAFWRWFAIGWILGLIMGFVRVYQGRHFISDVLWAGILVTLVSLTLYWLLLKRNLPQQTAKKTSA